MEVDEIKEKFLKFDEKIIRILNEDKQQKNDDYWHRRWAGDAMKGLMSNPSHTKTIYEAAKETGESVPVVMAGLALESANAMLKAYKEREDHREKPNV